MSPDGKSQTVGKQLAEMPFVEKIGTYEGGLFNYNFPSAMTILRGDNYLMLFCTSMDQRSFDLLGLKIIKDYGSANGGYYITEKALHQLGYTDETREIDWGTGSKDPIAGVLNDIQLANVLNAEVPPFAILIQKDKEFPDYMVKTNGDKRAKAAFQEMVGKLEDPDAKKVHGLERVQSIEESIEKAFENEQNTLDIISLFTLIAIIISVMGYLGLSLFFIRQRKKDIAIRKVMGSTSGEVLVLMLRTFSIPLLISFVIAVPISYYIMSDWLSNFSYRIALSPWIFAAAGSACFIISLLTVIIQSWRAASENPINNIKTE